MLAHDFSWTKQLVSAYCMRAACWTSPMTRKSPYSGTETTNMGQLENHGTTWRFWWENPRTKGWVLAQRATFFYGHRRLFGYIASKKTNVDWHKMENTGIGWRQQQQQHQQQQPFVHRRNKSWYQKKRFTSLFRHTFSMLEGIVIDVEGENRRQADYYLMLYRVSSKERPRRKCRKLYMVNTYGGVLNWAYPNSWMVYYVYFREHPMKNWMITRCSPISGNPIGPYGSLQENPLYSEGKSITSQPFGDPPWKPPDVFRCRQPSRPVLPCRWGQGRQFQRAAQWAEGSGVCALELCPCWLDIMENGYLHSID